jgi:hypothetical protein
MIEGSNTRNNVGDFVDLDYSDGLDMMSLLTSYVSLSQGVPLVGKQFYNPLLPCCDMDTLLSYKYYK